MATKTLISGHFIDKHGKKYFLVLEPAIYLGGGHYSIRREFAVEVWQITS